MSQVGYYCVFQYRQYCLKEETKKNIFKHLPEEELSVFNLSEISKTIEWKGDDEFSLHGKMYDLVKTIRTSAGETLVYAVADTNEDALMAKYAASAQNNAGKKQSSTSFFLFLLYLPVEQTTTSIFSTQTDKFLVTLSVNTHKGFYTSYYTPPRVV